MITSSFSHLLQLARLYNVQTAYYDVTRRRRQASAEGLLSVLRALGAPVKSLDDVAPALRERKQALHRRMMEPVTVAWNGKCPVIKVCVPAGMADSLWLGHLNMEDDRRKTWHWRAADLPVLDSIDIEGTRYITRGINLPEKLPWGYHRFFLELPGNTGETLIISAPVKTYLPSGDKENRRWGVFMPLYALQSRDSRGSGDYTALGSLADWISSLGGEAVATLPLLPTFLDEPFEPSPYAPVSRLMWNEFYIDIDMVPEVALLQSSSVKAATTKQPDLPLVDYRRLMATKRRILEQCCQRLLQEKTTRFHEYQAFIQANPIVKDYGRFRAVMETRRSPWPDWPERLRNGALNEGDYDEGKDHYHTYVQWLAVQQVRNAAGVARNKGATLYFDLPLGTHPQGYDVWHERESFALETTVGAPPDSVFTMGQDWGFPPLHPDRIREQGYRYTINTLRHHLQHAGMLRIDHVMGLHRLFCIPKGMDADHGVYVRYRDEELYAVLTLESHRHRSVIVGEDLGIVPAYVRPAMSRHGLQRMYVLHYELADNEKLHEPQGNVVASLNTHDMPPFASFWQGLDIPERRSLGLLNDKSARAERHSRQATTNTLLTFLHTGGWVKDKVADVRTVLKACLAFLSASRARLVLVNLEDLWLETQSQNVPGTDDRNLNWRRKARYTLEEFCRMPEVRDTLKEIDRLRKQAKEK
jgi:4-alpha-glucanotransferase